MMRSKCNLLCWLVSGLALVVAAPPTEAAWVATPLTPPTTVDGIRQAGAAVLADTGGEWLRLEACGDGICTSPAAPPPAAPVAPDGIPHGAVATADRGDIIRAWFAEPTTRYGHGVLGDAIEGGALTVVAAGVRHSLRLDRRHVFEDLTPRIADLDGDGANEVVVIRSGLDTGAALAVYGLRGGRLAEIAATPPIGRPHRWLNVAGIADYTGDGLLDIAVVVTPHIGGRLEVWTLAGSRLRRLAAADGFSNHAIGSTELGMAATADVDGDGVLDLVLPDSSRTALRIVSAKGGRVADLARVPLGGRAATAIGVVGGQHFVLGLDDGRGLVVAPRR